MTTDKTNTACRDFQVEQHHTLYLLTPETEVAKAWVQNHITDEHLVIGDTVVVEHGCIGDIIKGIAAEGLVVTDQRGIKLT